MNPEMKNDACSGTLSPFALYGAETGKVTPCHVVKDGVYLLNEDGSLRNVPVWMRLIGDQKQRVHMGYARQYLSKKGDGAIVDGELNWETWMLNMHEILIVPNSPSDGKFIRAFSPSDTLANAKGVISPLDMDVLPLRKLADGELNRLISEYRLFTKTQLPPYPTHEQMEQIIEEGKTCALGTLHSRHGSLALIQVLHGLGEIPWPM